MTTSMKLFIVLGTRPEAIKLAPLILLARATPDMSVTVCNTGQHQSMADEMLSAFRIAADFRLDVMRRQQTLTDVTTEILRAIEVPLQQTRPDWVVVQGDTSTSFAAALAAFYRKIPVAHVEAGLRTGDRYAPWPEEINRRLNSVLATLHLAPTPQSRTNLLVEGIAPEQIEVTGNTGIDALLKAVALIDADLNRAAHIRQRLVAQGLEFLNRADPPPEIAIVTAHRRENFGQGIESICRAVVALAARFPALPFVFPVHPNPEVTVAVERIIRPAALANIHAIEPVDYFAFAYLLRHAAVVMTDSGGLQEEAAALGKRLVVLRDVTERSEIVGHPGVQVVGTDEERIVLAVADALHMRRGASPTLDTIFGDGHAAERVVAALRKQT